MDSHPGFEYESFKAPPQGLEPWTYPEPEPHYVLHGSG